MCKKDIIKIMKYDDKNDKHMKRNDIKKFGVTWDVIRMIMPVVFRKCSTTNQNINKKERL